MADRDTSTSVRSPLLVGLAVIVAAVGLLTWAKYQPYLVSVPAVLGVHDLGPSILGEPGPVSLASGWDFTVAYLRAVWKALLVGLVLAAAVQVLLPAGWLRRALGRSGGVAGGVRGGLWSIPTLMCSCCAAPVAVGLRRARVSLPGTVAFWLGNPALNPVVLVFCLAVLPWPWTVLRLAGGVGVVAAGIAIARAAERRGALAAPVPVPDDAPVGPPGPLPARFVRSLAGMALRLVPELLGVVFLLGMFRGVLFPIGNGAGGGVLVGLLLVVAGLLLPVPTGGEVAVVAAALAAGAPPALAAILLVTLPALSLPSVLMVRTAVPRRVLTGVVGCTAGVALLAATLAPALL
ncbi:MAG: hypothetical protein JWQ45_2144 [Blastococcus sp.]|nr:hypothetical protein [Blastococcus sp.]